MLHFNIVSSIRHSHRSSRLKLVGIMYNDNFINKRNKRA